MLLTSLYFRRAPIHAEAPDFVEMSVQQEILETGIKVVDLLAPYAKGGKIGKFFFYGVGSICIFSIRNHSIMYCCKTCLHTKHFMLLILNVDLNYSDNSRNV